MAKKKSVFDNSLRIYFWLRQTSLDIIKHSVENSLNYCSYNLRNALLNLEYFNLNRLRFSFFRSFLKHNTALARFQFIHTHLNNSQSLSILKLESKVRRMESSFSWQITSPIRFIRRNFFDHRKLERRGQYCVSKKHYRIWIRKFDKIGWLKKRSFRRKIQKFEYYPLVSIILPVYDPNVGFFVQTLSSVLNQLYKNWELCICNDCSKNPLVQETIVKFASRDSRIKYTTLNENMHISHASNKAVSLAEGEFLAFLDHDDLFASPLPIQIY